MAEQKYRPLVCVCSGFKFSHRETSRRCRHCKAEYRPRHNVAMYCSKRCKVAACRAKPGSEYMRLKRAAAERAQRRAALIAEAESLAVRKAEQASAARTQRSLFLAEKRAAAMKACSTCGTIFNASGGRKSCSMQCRKARRKLAKRDDRARDKALRRGAERSSCERFSPMDVFERDGWRCQICGVRTPKSNRGTCKPNAPELDHIIAVSRGGEHSMKNCQCACRRCNGLKGAGAAIGQVRLFESMPGAGGRKLAASRS